MARVKLRIVRARDEARLRAATQRLLTNGYSVGEISGISLDAMGVMELLDITLVQARRRRAGHEVHALASVSIRDGRWVLKVRGLIVAAEGDVCRDPHLLGDRWTVTTLRVAASRINGEDR